MQVFVVDDDRDFRDSLVWLLQGAGMAVVAFDSAEHFLDTYRGEPGVLLLDLRMTGMSGLALQQEMQRRGIDLPVIMITGHGDVATAVQAMKNRAVDFIEKPFDDEALLNLVRETLRNMPGKRQDSSERQDAEARWATLSRREREVAKCVLAGMRNREISEALGISIKTVEVHRSRAMTKMGAANLLEFVTRAGELMTK